MDLPIEKNKKKRGIKNKYREWISGYAFISLWVIGLVAFTLFPLSQAFWYSLNEASFYGNTIKTTFQWFSNFTYAFFEDAIFPTIVANYLMEIVVEVPFSICASLIIGLCEKLAKITCSSSLDCFFNALEISGLQ